MDISTNLKKYREAKRWSYRQLAEKARVHFSHISKMEKGQVPNPGKETVARLAKALDVTEEDLCGTAALPPSTRVFHDSVNLKVFSYIHAGGAMVWQEVPDRMVSVSEDRARYGADLLAVEVLGECMVPDVLPGTAVVFDRNRRSPRNGDLVAVMVPGEGLQVRWYQVRDGKPMLASNIPGDEMEPDGAILEGIVIQVNPRVPHKPWGGSEQLGGEDYGVD